jgi:hypothetical protein
VNVDFGRRRYPDTEIDVAERQYRSKFQPNYREEVDVTIDPPRSQPSIHREYGATEETVDRPRFSSNMGYHDEDGKAASSPTPRPMLILEGHYHSLRHGLHRAAERIVGAPRHHHHDREEIDITIDSGRSGAAPRTVLSANPPNTVTIPTHHIRIGDLLILQGRPCQVIRITTSSSTGQHRYLGVDLFTKQLHEESSYVSNPSPSVIVQTMLGPVFKQYRVLDMQDGTGKNYPPAQLLVAHTNVLQSLP